MAFIAFLATVATIAAASDSSCPSGKPLRATAPVLLQKQSKVERSVGPDSQETAGPDVPKAGLDSPGAEGLVEAGWHSNCSQRLGHGPTHPAACVIIKDGKALLVYVPYGSPGWDLPGGWHKGPEAECETAEREACEETHHRVSAVQKIGFNVFRCELRQYNVCHKRVDEGFLRKGWFGLGDLDHIRFRPNTWGDKKGTLRSQLQSSAPPPAPAPSPPPPSPPAPSPPAPSPPSGERDDCGCEKGKEGWSTTVGHCRSSSWTSPEEAAACRGQHQGGSPDACGCSNGQGWSTTAGGCRSSSQTSPEEAAACRRGHQGSHLDACRCRIGREGWSTTVGRCRQSSWTSPEEARACRSWWSLAQAAAGPPPPLAAANLTGAQVKTA